MADCTVPPVAIEDGDHWKPVEDCHIGVQSDDQDYIPATPKPKKLAEDQHSSRTMEDLEDSELENIMGHHSVKEGYTFTLCKAKEHDNPHTEGTDFFLSPPALCTTQGEDEPDPKHNIQPGYVDPPPPLCLSPISPSRPKSPWGRFDPYDSTEDQDKEYVGFATLPNQVHRKSVKKGFDFTLMVAGESGLGKSTLVNSLFLTDLYKDRKLLNAEERITQTVEITKHTVDIEEKGVKLKLTIVDTPGFGDAVNNTECLRPLDVEFMKALHEKVNIVPVLAKADTLTPSEIREEIEQYGIKIYQFPDCDSDEDDEFKQQDQELKDSIPFAVIGSNTVVEAKGKRVRGRLYPWGIVEVENTAHCDFIKLRNMLVRTHMQDLKDVTRETHYENYRAHKLTRESGTDFPIPTAPNVTDTETEKLIREKDEELRRMQEMLQKIQAQMHNQKEAY
ncbi:Septin-4 [Bagarius yarrelli]|uniref:Septin-4 n=1 Tax=Bagarius yarrelli TaxID=175774 RepID=A0A556UY68_BAGYA|nr:Septin-4 [Bagarius yarrelli]